MRAWLLALTLSLSACGFHLAGNRPLPPELRAVYVDLVTPYSVAELPLESALQRLLQRRGARIVDTSGPGITVVQLSNLSEGREVLSLGADGKALEYQLITTVHYSVFSEGKVLLPPGDLRVTRDYSFNAQQVLAKEAEEERLREFIQGELAELLMLRIDAALQAATPLVPATDSAPAPTSGATPPS